MAIEKLPTPQVGDTLHWYNHANTNNEPAAFIVTQVEGLGRVSGTVFSRNAMPLFKMGVLHVSATQHIENPNNPVTVRQGGWDFKPKVSRYDVYEKEMAKRQENIRIAEEKAAEAQALREAREAEALAEEKAAQAEAKERITPKEKAAQAEAKERITPKKKTAKAETAKA